MELTSGRYLIVGNPAAGFSNTGLLAMGLSLGTNSGSVGTCAGEQLVVYASNNKVGEYVFGTRLKNNSAFTFEWSSTSLATGASDLILAREAAGVLGVRGGSTTTAGAVSLYTYGASPPAAPAASIVRIYADTSGAKIRLMAIFPSGAAQQIAIEP
jgi:hypothetical protein